MAGKPYFLFYSKNRVRVFFDRKGIFGKKRNEKDFHNLQVYLNRLCFSTYDMTLQKGRFSDIQSIRG